MDRLLGIGIGGVAPRVVPTARQHRHLSAEFLRLRELIGELPVEIAVLIDRPPVRFGSEMSRDARVSSFRTGRWGVFNPPHFFHDAAPVVPCLERP